MDFKYILSSSMGTMVEDKYVRAKEDYKIISNIFTNTNIFRIVDMRDAERDSKLIFSFNQ